MIRFQCPACQAGLEVSDALANQVMACDDCGRKLRVPLVSQKNVQESQTRKSYAQGRASRFSFALLFAAFLMFVGMLLAFAGGIITLGYWLGYSTTVRETSEDPFSTSIDYVHNTGLMNNRLVGVVVEVGLALSGILLFLGGYLGDILGRFNKR